MQRLNYLEIRDLTRIRAYTGSSRSWKVLMFELWPVGDGVAVSLRYDALELCNRLQSRLLEDENLVDHKG